MRRGDIRGPRAATVAIALLLAYGVVGRIDADVQQAAAEERKSRKESRGRAEPAPIWSQRCERRGMDRVARQADGGHWVIVCVPRKTIRA